MAPYEVLVQATISDMYFIHERATRIAVWNLFLLTGICGAGFISGYIIEDLGYEWVRNDNELVALSLGCTDIE